MRQTLVLNSLALLLPVPSENSTMVLPDGAEPPGVWVEALMKL